MQEYCHICDAEQDVIENSSVIDNQKSATEIKRTRFIAYHCAVCNSFIYSETEEMEDITEADDPTAMPTFY